MLRFLADENLNHHIVRACRLREPGIDIVTVQDVGLRGEDDATILEWAAANRRIVVTHDVSTMTRHAYERVDAGKPMPGLVEVASDAALGILIDDLLLLALASGDDEWAGVLYVPLR
jgi:GAF domain-containing protein